MPAVADRVRDITTTTGTGTVTLSGTAPSGFRTFATAFGAAPTQVRYAIVGDAEWEVGTGTFDGTTGLTRDGVVASSNANALVAFSAGAKDVFCTVSSPDVRAGSNGRALALARGWAMS